MLALITLAAALAADLTVDLASVVSTGAPNLLSGRPIAECGGTRGPLSRLTDDIARAEGAIAYLDFPAARTALATARADAVCLEEPLAGNLAARIPFLEGIAAHLSKEGDALAHFRASLTIRPLQPWDPTYPPEAMLVFDRARGQIEVDQGVQLTLIPAPAEGALWVDGQRWTGGATLSLRTGGHYIQLANQGWRTLYLDVQGPEILAIPAWVGSDLDAWMANPAQAEMVSRLLARRFDPGLPVRVRAGDAVWAGTVGGAGWNEVPPPPLPRRAPFPRALLGTSSVTFAVGATLLAGGLVGMYDAVDAAETTDKYDEFRIARGRYEMSRTLVEAGRWVTAVGAVGVGVSVPLVLRQDARHKALLQSVRR